ncbi:zonular occludens toxin domain-containing protein [Acinetobacter bouvetii]|uniref:Zonular occludens toxin (Zot) n=1 Tax=Acinetobacter bouvetii TaxID=202951 RepID=A0A811GDB7_9GAMM|nr:zonular occludens toxin domain-containing protein [Acinetobacter bouvetii]CAB1221488.1 Zonular occludens toxin (Zot) [Acinetobacter bouvetii]
MAIQLITGKPGSYKSAYLMSMALDEIQKGRLVYFCNFRGLQAEKYQLNVLDHFNEWASVPDGALVIIDEVQEFTRDVPTNAKTEELPQWMTLLEKHRHRGIDIFVVTQHPMFIHTHIRRLLEKHIHMQRVQGMPWSNKREWQQVCSDPENIDNATIKKGCTTTIYRPNKKVFDYYESTVVDTHKFKVPRKLITSLAMVGGALAFVYWIGAPVFNKYINTNGDKEVVQQMAENTNPSNSNAPNPNFSAENQLKVNISKCIDQLNLTEQQCAEMYNPDLLAARHAELEQTTRNNMDQIVIDYAPENPFKPVQVQYEVTAKPVFSGCVKMNGKYVAYTQQGTRLEVDPSVCRRVIDDGDRPFNYFKNDQQLQANNLQQPQVQQIATQPQAVNTNVMW